MCAPDLPGTTTIRLVEVSGRDFEATKHGRTHSCNLESRGAVAVVDIEEARWSIISIITLRLSPRSLFVDRGRVRSERCFIGCFLSFLFGFTGRCFFSFTRTFACQRSHGEGQEEEEEASGHPASPHFEVLGIGASPQLPFGEASRTVWEEAEGQKT